MKQNEMEQGRFDRFVAEAAALAQVPEEVIFARTHTPKHVAARRILSTALFLDGHPKGSIGRMYNASPVGADHTTIGHQLKTTTTLEARMAKEVLVAVDAHVGLSFDVDDLLFVAEEVEVDPLWGTGLGSTAPMRLARVAFEMSLVQP